MKPLDYLLLIIELAAQAAKGVGGDVGIGAEAADAIIRIVQAANGAYQQITGQPIDLSKLQPIEPIP